MVKPIWSIFYKPVAYSFEVTAGFRLETTRHINFTYGITMTGSQRDLLIDSFSTELELEQLIRKLILKLYLAK